MEQMASFLVSLSSIAKNTAGGRAIVDTKFTYLYWHDVHFGDISIVYALEINSCCSKGVGLPATFTLTLLSAVNNLRNIALTRH
jgi:hypothetical protein